MARQQPFVSLVPKFPVQSGCRPRLARERMESFLVEPVRFAGGFNRSCNQPALSKRRCEGPEYITLSGQPVSKVPGAKSFTQFASNTVGFFEGFFGFGTGPFGGRRRGRIGGRGRPLCPMAVVLSCWLFRLWNRGGLRSGGSSGGPLNSFHRGDIHSRESGWELR